MLGTALKNRDGSPKDSEQTPALQMVHYHGCVQKFQHLEGEEKALVYSEKLNHTNLHALAELQHTHKTTAQ